VEPHKRLREATAEGHGLDQPSTRAGSVAS
jgi:hypothetical protein